jgi:hypothetical protein
VGEPLHSDLVAIANAIGHRILQRHESRHPGRLLAA